MPALEPAPAPDLDSVLDHDSVPDPVNVHRRPVCFGDGACYYISPGPLSAAWFDVWIARSFGIPNKFAPPAILLLSCKFSTVFVCRHSLRAVLIFI